MRIYLVPGSISKDNSELLKHSSSKEKEVAQDKILVSRLRIQDEPYILMIHKETEYVAVLKADQDKSLSTLGKQVKEALIDALIKEGIRRDVAARFLSPEEDILYFEMNEKMDVKSIKSKGKILKEMILPYEEPYLKNLVKKNINRIPVKKGKDFVIPIDEMIKLLEKRYGYPVIRQKAYTFQITCSHQIKNRKYILTAPEWFPVYQLHEVIGFLMGFEINEYWMEDYGRSVVSGNSLNKSMNSEEKEHTFADDDTKYVIRNTEDLRMLFHSYSYLREINKEELIYDLSGKKEDFIYLERQEIQAEYHYSYPRIQKGISATEKEGNLEEEVLQLNIELELYYK